MKNAIDKLIMASTEEEVRQTLEELRWGEGFSCPGCGHGKGYKLKTRNVTECAKCGKQTSATAGTIFHGARKLLIWTNSIKALLEKKHLSARKDALKSGERYATVWQIRQKLRLALNRTFDSESWYEIILSCMQIKSALTKRSREPGKLSENKGPDNWKLAGMAKEFTEYLKANFTGISRKYTQLYGAEYSLVMFCGLELVNKTVQKLPFLLPIKEKDIQKYESPLLVHIRIETKRTE